MQELYLVAHLPFRYMRCRRFSPFQRFFTCLPPFPSSSDIPFMISSEQDSPSFPASFDSWTGFTPGTWTESIKVRDFIQKNYTPYGGNEDFLSGPSSRTLQLWDHLKTLLTQEIDQGGVLDADEEVVSSITSHKPGYIAKDLEVVVGLQTDAPLKRALMPFGGLRMAQQAPESYGFKMCEKTSGIFQKSAKPIMKVFLIPPRRISAINGGGTTAHAGFCTASGLSGQTRLAQIRTGSRMDGPAGRHGTSGTPRPGTGQCNTGGRTAFSPDGWLEMERIEFGI